MEEEPREKEMRKSKGAKSASGGADGEREPKGREKISLPPFSSHCPLSYIYFFPFPLSFPPLSNTQPIFLCLIGAFCLLCTHQTLSPSSLHRRTDENAF